MIVKKNMVRGDYIIMAHDYDREGNVAVEVEKALKLYESKQYSTAVVVS